MPDPIELHYWPTPNGWKVSILLEELGLPYTVKTVNIGKGEQFEPEFLKIAPNNRMPAIIDPDGPAGAPISIFESGAIMQYLARKHGQFYGDDDREQVQVEEWLMWQMGGLGPMAGQTHHFLYATKEPVPYGVERYRNESARLYGVLDRRLEGRDFVAGRYSIADMAIWGWANVWKRHEQAIDDFPNVKAWLGRVGGRPAVQKGRALHADLRPGPPPDEETLAILYGAS